MANGIITLTSSNRYLQGRIVWESAGNYVSASLQLASSNGHTGTTGTWSWSISIGTSSDSGTYYGFIGPSWVEIGRLGVSVFGSTVNIYGKGTAPSGTSIAGASCSASAVVTVSAPDPEPEAKPSTILSATDARLGEYASITWKPDRSDLYYTVSYDIDNGNSGYTTYEVRFQPGTTGSYTGKILMRYEIANTITSGLTKSVRIKLTTHTTAACNSSDMVGSASYKTITVTIPEDDNTRPEVTYAGYEASPDPFGGAYIQGNNGVRITAIEAKGKYGATIASSYFRVEGASYASGEASDAFIQNGNITVTVFAVDSRGFTSKGYAIAVNVLPYSKPKLKPVSGQSRVNAVRCDKNGITNPKGAYLKIMAKREYSPVIYNGAQRNFCKIQYRYKLDAGTSWSSWSVILSETGQEDEITTAALLGTLSETSSYRVEIQAIDTLGGYTTAAVVVSSDKIYWHRDGARGSLGFGKYVEEDNVLDISDDKTLIVRGALRLSGEAGAFLLDFAHPIGSVLETVNATNPGTYLGGTWVRVTGTDTTSKWRRTE